MRMENQKVDYHSASAHKQARAWASSQISAYLSLCLSLGPPAYWLAIARLPLRRMGNLSICALATSPIAAMGVVIVRLD